VAESYDRITPAMKRHVLRMYRALDPACFSGWEERLHAATGQLPTLVLWGDRDPYIPRRYADRFGGQVRHFKCGHWLQVEQPAMLAAALREFLA
jgi:haloalkane dehalogenase